MKGRLTLDKVNAAINDMAGYADANAQLIEAPRKKVLNPKLILFFTFSSVIFHLSCIYYPNYVFFSFAEAERDYLGKSTGE